MNLSEVSNHLKIKENHQKEVVDILNNKKKQLRDSMKSFGPSIFIFENQYQEFFEQTLDLREEIDFIQNLVDKSNPEKTYQTEYQKYINLIFPK